MLSNGILSCLSFAMECSCKAPLSLVVMAIRGLTFHPFCLGIIISGSYFML